MSEFTDTEGTFDDDDVDALDSLQIDAYQRRANGEATAKAFGALERISEVLMGVRDEKAQIDGAAAFVEQLRRLSQIATDYYAARGDAAE